MAWDSSGEEDIKGDEESSEDKSEGVIGRGAAACEEGGTQCRAGVSEQSTKR